MRKSVKRTGRRSKSLYYSSPSGKRRVLWQRPRLTSLAAAARAKSRQSDVKRSRLARTKPKATPKTSMSSGVKNLTPYRPSTLTGTRVGSAKSREKKIAKGRTQVVKSALKVGHQIHKEILKTKENHSTIWSKIFPLAKKIGLPILKQAAFNLPVVGDGLRMLDYGRQLVQSFIHMTKEVPKPITQRAANPDQPGKYRKITFNDAVKESKKWDFSGLSADKAGVAPQLLVGDHAKRVQREEVVPMITND